MFYPQLRVPRQKLQSVISTPGDGINTHFPPQYIKPSEAVDVVNMNARYYPALQTRYGRELFSEHTGDIWAIGERNNEYLHVQEGTAWKYYDGVSWVEVLPSGLTEAEGKFLDFVRGSDRNTILMNGTNRIMWDGTDITNLTDAPLTNKFTVHKGRVYAIDGTMLRFSALNKADDWTSVNDSGFIQITQAKGEATGIVTYNDYVTIFTKSSMHRLFGTGPESYQLVDVNTAIGCVSDKSIVTCNSTLYFAGFDGIYASDGAFPRKVSQRIDGIYRQIPTDQMDKISAGIVNNESLIISLPVGTGITANNIIVRYDPINDRWFTEDGEFDRFVNIDFDLYGVNSDNDIMLFETGNDDDGTDIDWEWESGARYSRPSALQTLSEVWIVYDGADATSVNFYVSASLETDDWVLVKTLDAHTSSGTERIQIPLTYINDIEYYRLKITGTGQMKIYNIEEIYRVR